MSAAGEIYLKAPGHARLTMVSHPLPAPHPHRQQPAVPSPPAQSRQWPGTAPAGQRRQSSGSNTLLVILLTVGVLAVVSVLVAAGLSAFYSGGPGQATVALIPLDGMIVSESGQAGLFTPTAAGSDTLVSYIKSADEDSSISAIVLDIDSPGGSPVASEEVARAVLEAKKPTVALIRETGASGAYWVASASDWIIANRLSITGSVGVYASQLEFAGLLQRYNVTYRRLVAGELKDLGTPYKEMTPAEEDVLQQKLDRMHAYFLGEVVRNGGLLPQQAEEVSTAVFFLGEEAIEVGLVDELGGMDEVEAYLKETLGVDEIAFVEYRRTPGFLESLGTLAASFVPRTALMPGAADADILLR